MNTYAKSILVLVVLALIGGGVYAWSNRMSSGSTESQDTSTWKNYTSDEYGFEFKYPSTWKECPTDGTPRFVRSDVDCHYSESGPKTMTGEQPVPYIVYDFRLEVATSNIYDVYCGDCVSYKQLVDSLNTGCVEPGPGCEMSTSVPVKELTVDGRKAICIDVFSPVGAADTEFYIFDKNRRISFYVPSTGGGEGRGSEGCPEGGEMESIRQIISTLKFTN